MTINNNNTGPLENLLDRISEMELDSRRQEKYDRLVAIAVRKNRLKKRLFAGIAAITAAACFTAIIIITTSAGKPESGELFQSFYSPHDFPIEYRGKDSLNTIFLESVRLYSKSRSDQAQDILTPLLDVYSNNPDYILLMSQILMEQKKYDSSIVYLKQVIESKGSYERTGFWYLALSYLATEKYNECLETLDRLIESADPQLSKKATRLKRKIKRKSVDQ